MLSHAPDKPNRRIKYRRTQYYTLLQQHDIDYFMTKIRQSPGHLADEATKHMFIFNEKSFIGTLKRCRYSWGRAERQGTDLGYIRTSGSELGHNFSQNML